MAYDFKSASIQGRKSGSSNAKLFDGMQEEDSSAVVEGSRFKFEICQYHHLSLLIQSSLFLLDHDFAKDVLSKALCLIVSKLDVRYIDERQTDLVSRCL